MKKAPELTQKDVEAINRLFQPIIFRRNRTKELWTSCCGRHAYLKESANEAEERIIHAPHTPEEIRRQYWARPINELESSRRVTCPYCGAEAKLKELGRCGDRKNLWSYRRPVVLKVHEGKLWAIACDAEKGYRGFGREDTKILTGKPNVRKLAIYRFEAGRACCVHFGYTNWVDVVENPGKKRSWMLSAPYNCSNEYGTGYDVIGMEEIAKSEFKYCEIQKLQGKGCDLMRLLTLCCFYPRQVEFLAKVGLIDAVKDYTEHGIKSHEAVKWDAERPQDFLGVSVQEAKELAENGGGTAALRVYRAMRESGGASIEESVSFERAFDGKSSKTILSRAKKYGVTIGKMMRYLDAQREKRGDKTTLYAIGEEYKDYLIAAEGVGMDLHNPVFLLPKDLRRKHDEVTAAYSQILAEKRSAEEEEAYRPRREALEKRYAFSYGGMCVVVPSCANAIVEEGKQLHHCVGGYADRHIKGETTILFLRRENDQKKPLVTMEVSGTRIIQIHGWDDERTACKENPKRVSPSVLYQEFLDIWTAWLIAGSKRDKDGAPKLPRKFEEVKTA